MNTRKPKEREHYRIRLEDGTLVEVTREVYLCWYQMRRKEKYQKEKEQKHHVYSLEAMQGNNFYSDLSIPDEVDVENIVLRDFMREQVREMIRELTEYEQAIVYCLYYLNLNTVETAQELWKSRRIILFRKRQILEKLKKKCTKRKIDQI